MGECPPGEAVCFVPGQSAISFTDILTRGLYDPDLEKDACGVGFAW